MKERYVELFPDESEEVKKEETKSTPEEIVKPQQEEDKKKQGQLPKLSEIIKSCMLGSRRR